MPVYVQDKLKPRGSSKFPLIDAQDVLVGYDADDNNREIRLDEKLEELEATGGGGGGNVNVDASLSKPGWAADAAEVGNRLEDIHQAVIEDTSGGSGYVRNIQTFNGSKIMRLFIGTQEEYEKLSPDDKEDLLSIITNGGTEEEIIEAISKLRTDVDNMLDREPYKLTGFNGSQLQITGEGLFIVELLYIVGDKKEFLGSGILRCDGIVTHSCVLDLDTIVSVDKDGYVSVFNRNISYVNGSIVTHYEQKNMENCEIYIQRIGVV